MARVRPGALGAARIALLAGPSALAFFSGGYFDGPRAWAGFGAWLVVLVAVAMQGTTIPSGTGARLAIASLGLLAVWSLLSIVWAPIAGNAYHAGQIVVLYVGVLLAGTLLLKGPPARGWVEPALGAGALVVIGYGLSGRLLPGVLHFAHSVSAQGRLEQPLTYWNAMGELAALGFILCARMAGDTRRPSWLRAIGTAATAPLGMGLYVTFSRGALFACVAGLIALAVLAPQREQLVAIVQSIVIGALAAVAAAPFRGVTSLSGTLSTRESQGLVVLALLAAIVLVAAVGQLRRRSVEGELRLPRGAAWIAAAVVCAGLALAIVVGSHENSGSTQTLSGGATRLTSLQSNRYDYWHVALRAFASEPLHGVGAGGWSIDWLRWRTVTEFAQDAHSLELQTLAELGVVGLALLVAFFTGVAVAARRALARDAGFAAGPVAALVVYLAHSPLDWDWQMPAVTVVAMILAGALLALAGDQV